MDTLQTVGLICVVAAVVGGGMKLLGAELPVLSTRRQVVLGLLGILLLAAHAGIFSDQKPSPEAGGSTAPPPTATVPHTIEPSAAYETLSVIVTHEDTTWASACAGANALAFQKCIETPGAIDVARQATDGKCTPLAEPCSPDRPVCQVNYVLDCVVAKKG